MTEAEWLAGDDPLAMLAYLGESMTLRKRQLYCLACWAALRPNLEDDNLFRCGLDRLEAAEDVDWRAKGADHGDETEEALTHVDCALIRRLYPCIAPNRVDDAYRAGTEAALVHWDDEGCLAAGAAYVACSQVLDAGFTPYLSGGDIDTNAADLAVRLEAGARRHGAWPTYLWWRCRKANADLAREVFGNPFRSAGFDTAWRTPSVIAVARNIYDERRFQDLPVLADALEEAGCADADLLEHVRGPGPHVRGCWVVEMVRSPLGEGHP